MYFLKKVKQKTKKNPIFDFYQKPDFIIYCICVPLITSPMTSSGLIFS